MVFATSASMDMSPPLRMPGRFAYALPTSYTPRSRPSSGTWVVSTSFLPECSQAETVFSNEWSAYSGMPPMPKVSSTTAEQPGISTSKMAGLNPGVSLSATTRSSRWW